MPLHQIVPIAAGWEVELDAPASALGLLAVAGRRAGGWRAVSIDAHQTVSGQYDRDDRYVIVWKHQPGSLNWDAKFGVTWAELEGFVDAQASLNPPRHPSMIAGTSDWYGPIRYGIVCDSSMPFSFVAFASTFEELKAKNELYRSSSSTLHWLDMLPGSAGYLAIYRANAEAHEVFWGMNGAVHPLGTGKAIAAVWNRTLPVRPALIAMKDLEPWMTIAYGAIVWHSDIIGPYGVHFANRQNVISVLGTAAQAGYYPYRLTAAYHGALKTGFTAIVQTTDQRLPRQVSIRRLISIPSWLADVAKIGLGIGDDEPERMPMPSEDVDVPGPDDSTTQPASPWEPVQEDVEVSDPQDTATQPTPPGLLALENIDLFMITYMQKRNIRAGSLAVTLDSRLVFAHAYTWAEPGYPITTPLDAFYLGSIAKVITSIAFHRLFAQGVLSPNDHLTSVVTTIKTKNGDPPANPWWNSIRIKDLLNHRVPWAGCPGACYVGQDEPWLADQLGGVPLPITKLQQVQDAAGNAGILTGPAPAPPTPVAYSNFNFIVLGHVIEQLTLGQPYADWMKLNVWKNAGFIDEQLDARRLDILLNAAGPVPGCSYGAALPKQVLAEPGVPVVEMAKWRDLRWEPVSYAYNPLTGDASGGWVAAPLDLLRLYSALDTTAGADKLIDDSLWLLHMYGADGGWVNDPDYYAAGWLGHNGGLGGGIADSARTPYSPKLSFAYAFNVDPPAVIWPSPPKMLPVFPRNAVLIGLVQGAMNTGVWNNVNLWSAAGLPP